MKTETTTTTTTTKETPQLSKYATCIQQVDGGSLTQSGVSMSPSPFDGEIPEGWTYDQWVNQNGEDVRQWTS